MSGSIQTKNGKLYIVVSYKDDTYTHLDFTAKISSAITIATIFNEENVTIMPTNEQILLQKIAELEDKIKLLSSLQFVSTN